MKIEMGESLFYSWLRHVKECQIVQTNWTTSGQWTLLHEDKLEEIKSVTDKFFSEKRRIKPRYEITLLAQWQDMPKWEKRGAIYHRRRRKASSDIKDGSSSECDDIRLREKVNRVSVYPGGVQAQGANATPSELYQRPFDKTVASDGQNVNKVAQKDLDSTIDVECNIRVKR